MAKKKVANAVMAHGPMDDMSWRGRHDCETLIEAEKIKADPARMKAAMKHRNETMKHYAKLGKGK